MSKSRAAFQRNARDFNDHLSSLLTRTITPNNPLKPIIRPNAAFISFRGAEKFGDKPSVELANGCSIRVSQIILPNEERPEKVTTDWYSYSYALGPNHDRDWLVRYDYVPGRAEDPEHEYPIAHVHFNGDSRAYKDFQMPGKRELERLHFPTRRISLEDFIEHLIIELKVLEGRAKDEALSLLKKSRAKYENEKRIRDP